MLLRAIQARAEDLRGCERPPGAAPKVLSRIRVAKTGAVQGASFADGADLPRDYRECLKQKIAKWSFPEVSLAASVNVLVEFAL